MIIHDPGGLGRVEVTTIPMPDYVEDAHATYTYSGKVLVSFFRADDPPEKDYFYLAVVNDDGSEFRTIFSGVIHQHKKANGIRYMPFADNKRALLGDYVLECEPDIDTCQRTTLVPVKYPWLLHLDPRTFRHWSEIIIAPDNKHIAWTILRTDIGAAVGLGTLRRKRNAYVIENPQIISSMEGFKKDKANPGYLLPQPVLGGEVKQFVKGGRAISMVGGKDGYVADSVVQDLASGEVTQITRTPGYDETTIFSPDECLGIVMSARGSPKTDPAILGWMPRPHGRYVSQGLTMGLYMYAVAGVRSFRQGNVGPVLIDIERSMNEPGYRGVLLNDPEEKWVYVSPMSWHPGGKKAMWLEMIRGSGEGEGRRQIRVRKVTLHDVQPQPTVPVQRTPDDIPYGRKGLQGALSLWLAPDIANVEGKIAGQHSGYIEYQRQGRKPLQAFMGSAASQYVNYTDDGKTFFNGSERASFSPMRESVYEADLEMTGAQQGEIKLRMTFSKVSFEQPPKLLFEIAEDGKPKSHGYVTYNGVTLRVEDLSE